jgi:competence protein ComEC
LTAASPARASRAMALGLSSLVTCGGVGVPWLATACSRLPDRAQTAGEPVTRDAGAPAPMAASSAAPPAACGGGRRLAVHVYDVGEGLAALVDLPDGRHLLVDTGDGAHRTGCGDVCERSARHLIAQLRSDLHAAPIDLLWITHQHADHIGGAPEVLEAFSTAIYVDNGRDRGKPEVRRAHAAAERRGAALVVVDPTHAASPIAASPDVRLTPIVPPSWPGSCAHDPNECSIALRIDYCASSVLFTGDAEHEEEALLDPGGRVTLLQVGHHGSDTSTTPGFLSRVRPRYAVISAGRPGEGYNRVFCHPRAIVVRRLARVLAGPAAEPLQAFDGDRCDRAIPSEWIAVPTTDALWATERDGDVVLATSGDGSFHRELGGP